MPRLDWTKNEQGWKAGRYLIEEVDEGVWVCSRVRWGAPSVEMIARSRREIQEGMETRDRRVRATWRAVFYALAFLGFGVLTFRATNWETRTFSAVVMLSSAAATFCFIGVIEGVVSRYWKPPPKLPYR